MEAVCREKEDMEHGKATERHGWLTANGNQTHYIKNQPITQGGCLWSRTNENSLSFRRIGGTTYKVRVVFNESGGETMEDKILRIVRNDMVTSDGTYGIMETPQMSRQSERSAS